MTRNTANVSVQTELKFESVVNTPLQQSEQLQHQPTDLLPIASITPKQQEISNEPLSDQHQGASPVKQQGTPTTVSSKSPSANRRPQKRLHEQLNISRAFIKELKGDNIRLKSDLAQSHTRIAQLESELEQLTLKIAKMEVSNTVQPTPQPAPPRELSLDRRKARAASLKRLNDALAVHDEEKQAFSEFRDFVRQNSSESRKRPLIAATPLAQNNRAWSGVV